MFSLINGVYKLLTQRPQFNILVIGSSSVGKTHFTSTLKQRCTTEGNSTNNNNSSSPSPSPSLQPTVGLNVVKFLFDGCDIVLWDLGGATELQTIWEDYYADCHAVIYVVNYDESDDTAITNDVTILEGLASNKVLQTVPMMIIANWRGTRRAENKQFEKYFISQIQRIVNLRLEHYPVFLKEANVATGEGLYECFNHLISYLKDNGRSVDQNDFI